MVDCAHSDRVVAVDGGAVNDHDELYQEEPVAVVGDDAVNDPAELC